MPSTLSLLYLSKIEFDALFQIPCICRYERGEIMKAIGVASQWVVNCTKSGSVSCPRSGGTASIITALLLVLMELSSVRILNSVVVAFAGGD